MTYRLLIPLDEQKDKLFFVYENSPIHQKFDIESDIDVPNKFLTDKDI